MNIYYNNSYTASFYAFETTRKSGWIVESLVSRPIDGITVGDPFAFTDHAEEMIGIIHDTAYVRAVKTGTPRDMAESQGFRWDAGIYPMAVSHTAGLVAAATDAISSGMRAGSLSSGLHHASDIEGAGFCTFNGLAVAAYHARTHLQRRNVLILDFDAHCGGGTFGLVGHIATQIDVSTSLFDAYHADGDHRLLRADHTDYLVKIDEALEYATKIGPWDLIIYNAGMDPINSGVSMADLERREQMVRKFVDNSWCPAIFALAGGYLDERVDEAVLVDAHRLTLAAWA